jgi:methyl-accepting chemotaxis protein
MARLNITAKIWLSIAVFVLGTLVAVGIGQVQAMAGEGRLAYTNAVLFPAAQHGQEAEALVQRMAKGFGDAVVLEDETALEQAGQDGIAAATLLKQTAELFAADRERAAALRELAASVEKLVEDGRAAYAPVIAAAGNLTPEIMTPVQQVAPRLDALKQQIAERREALAGDLRNELAAAVQRSARQRWMQLGVFVLALVVASVVVTVTIRRAVVTPIRTIVDELTTAAGHVSESSGQVSSAAQSLSQGATEQAASLEETSASMEEMASMTRQNAENSQAAASLMGEVDARVDGSNRALGEMVRSMASIQESSRQVAKIIKTIDEIAFQTNILALNAAVEAARAGEAGMGFAVVADEVRNLAQRSAQAARDTADMIEASIKRTEVGSRKVDEVAQSIGAITESVTRVKGLVEDVSVASRQQAQGIDQVSQAIAQMEKVTQTTAATAEESAAASEDLNSQAGRAMNVVTRLEALLGGRAATAPSAQPVSSAPAAQAVAAFAPGAPPIDGPETGEEQLPATGTYGSF